MTNISHIRKNVHTEVREKFIEILGDSLDNVDGEELIDFAVDNVFETSGIEDEGVYNKADINLAVQRSIEFHLNRGKEDDMAKLVVEEFQKDHSNLFLNYEKSNKITKKILSGNEYNWLNLSDIEIGKIYERTESVRDEEAIELIINKLLLSFGYSFDPEHLKWTAGTNDN